MTQAEILKTIKEVSSWFSRQKRQAYIVGGQSRRYLKDGLFDGNEFDLATSASAKEVYKMLIKRRVLPLAINETFGLVSFKYNGLLFEVTAFREDLYSKEDLERTNRYPSQVNFGVTLKKDSERRDFTINAIYLELPSLSVQDFHKGKADLKQGVIRTIGKAGQRFQEDPLRILRAIRLKHDLDFKFDASTNLAVKKYMPLVRRLNPGVLKKEIQKLQELEDAPEIIKELKKLGFLPSL
jgi:tRNA nucleotidyltransferase/poly(A) polymerase